MKKRANMSFNMSALRRPGAAGFLAQVAGYLHVNRLEKERNMAPLSAHPVRRIGGPVRVGIFFTCVWVIGFPLAYLLGAYFNPPFLHDSFQWAYVWWEDVPTPADPLGLFSSFEPEVRIGAATLLTFGVPGVLWLLLFVLPKSLAWVAEGFRHE